MNRLFLIFTSCLIGIGAIQAADASSVLKDIEIRSPSQIAFVFDSNMNASAISMEPSKDSIHLHIKNSSVYPAKIQTLENSEVTRVFAYQYSSALVRVRFSFKNALPKDWNKFVQTEIKGKEVLLNIGEGIVTAQKADEGKTIVVAKAAADAEQNLLSRVIKESAENGIREAKVPVDRLEKAKEKAPADKVEKNNSERSAADKAPATEKASSEKSTERANSKGSDSTPLGKLTGKTSQPSLGKSLGAFMFVLIALGLFLVGLSRLKRRSKGTQAGGLSKGIRKLFDKEEQLVEVLSTQSLGPKKSITVVRISGQKLVLGVTEESIQVLSRIGDSGELVDPSQEDQDSFDFMVGGALSSDRSPAPRSMPMPAARPATRAEPTRSEPIRSEPRNEPAPSAQSAFGRNEYSQNQNHSANNLPKSSAVRDRIRKQVGQFKQL